MDNFDKLLEISRINNNSLYEGYNYGCYSMLRRKMFQYLDKHKITYFSEKSWINNRLCTFSDPEPYINYSLVRAEYTRILRDLYLRARYGYKNLKLELLQKIFIKKYLTKLQALVRGSHIRWKYPIWTNRYQISNY